jgi:hypothetical protein
MQILPWTESADGFRRARTRASAHLPAATPGIRIRIPARLRMDACGMKPSPPGSAKTALLVVLPLSPLRRLVMQSASIISLLQDVTLQQQQTENADGMTLSTFASTPHAVCRMETRLGAMLHMVARGLRTARSARTPLFGPLLLPPLLRALRSPMVWTAAMLAATSTCGFPWRASRAASTPSVR